MSNAEEKVQTYSQGQYIQGLIEGKTQVNVYLVNGIKLQGTIVAQDQFTLLLLNNNKNPVTQLVYKHAVSTVQPAST